MNSILSLFSPELTEAIGWTILHSLWQGLLISVLLTVTLVLFKKLSATSRYNLALSALALLMTTIGITFFVSLDQSSSLSSNDQSVFSPYVMDDQNFDVVAPLIHTPVENDLVFNETISESTSVSFLDYFAPNIPMIVLLWWIGVLLLMMRLLGEFVYLQHLKKTAISLNHSLWKDSFKRMIQYFRIKRTPELVQSRRVKSPMVVGFLKPLVIIPIGLVNNLSPKEVESILAHELAHVQRFDYVINVFQSFAETLLFFNPAVWWISAMIRTEREYCCDDVAIKITGDNVNFVKTLARLEEWRFNHNALSLGFAKSKKGVLGRVHRIVKGEPTRKLPYKMFWSFLTVGIVICAMAVQLPSQEQNLIDAEPPVKEQVEEVQMDQVEETNESPPETSSNDFQLIPEGPSSSMEVPEEDNEDYDEMEAETAEEEYLDQMLMTDSVPDEIEKLKLEMEKIQMDFERKRLEAQKQHREIEKQILMVEQDGHKMESQQRPAMIELEKQEQLLRLKKEEYRNEFRMKRGELRLAMLQLEKEAREMELQALKAGEDADNSQLEQKIEAKFQQMEEQEQVIRQEEIMMEQKVIELEQQIQQLENKAIELDTKQEIDENNLEMKILDLEEKRNMLEYQWQIMESEMQIKMSEMHMRIQEAKAKRRMLEKGSK